MLTDCPDPKETSDFHFRQLRTVRVTKANENIPIKPVNLLASASQYGLLFIGMEGGFKVVKLDDVLALDEDRENRSIETKFAHSLVPCGTPSVLTVNGSQKMLAVCIQTASAILIHLYSLAAYFNTGSLWQPFCSSTLSPSPHCVVQDFVWNPAVEGLFAFCLSDGSLHIQEINGSSLRPVSSLQNANAVSVCWSPKGKQLVAGKRNGCFTQYKPTLQEVKTIAPPNLEEGPIAATSICWISNIVFAVVYVAGDVPNLFIVSTPKDGAIVYTNFNDICLGNNNASYQKYFLHLEPLWGILICASLDSIEIAVLGDMPNWVPWDLREDGKALLPGKDGATHAVGIAVMYSAQRQIVISDSESYSPMPVLFLLTNNGLLVSFHMINTKTEAPVLVSPPLPMEYKGRDFSSDAGVQMVPNGQQPLLSQSSAFENASIAVKTPVSSVASQPQNTNSSSCKMANSTIIGTANKYETSSLQKMQENPTQKNTSFSAVEKEQSEVQLGKDNSYRMAIITEIQSFAKELHDFKQLHNNSTPLIDGDEDMISLKMFALNLQNFQNDILQTMQSISSDVYTLKNALLESFAMVEEACSRERRRNDHCYITMLKERALDPVTAKRMQKINQHYQYLRTQLQEVSDRLDQDWIQLISNKKKTVRSTSCVSSAEAIYKTIVNNQKIIHNLKRKVNVLLKKAEEQQLRNTSKSAGWGKHHRRSTHEDLSKLADEFLLTKLTHQETVEPSVAKKLSKKSQDSLKAFLKKSTVITVRPTAVYSPSQSRLLSNAISPKEPSRNDQERVSTVQPPETRAVVSTSPASNVVPPKMGSETTSFEPTSVNEYSPKQNVPVYEPVSPPEVTNSPEPTKKDFSTATAGMFSPLSTNKRSEWNPQLFQSSTANEDSTIQERGLNFSTNTENRINPMTIPSPASTKFVSFSQASSEIKSTPSSSPAFTSIIQSGSQSSTLKPAVTSSFATSKTKDKVWSISDITSPKSVVTAPDSSPTVAEIPMPSVSNQQSSGIPPSASQPSFVNAPFTIQNLKFFPKSPDNSQSTVLENRATSVSPSNSNANLTSKSPSRPEPSIDVQKSFFGTPISTNLTPSVVPKTFNLTPSDVAKTSDAPKLDASTFFNSPPNMSVFDLKQSESSPISKSSAIIPPNVSLVSTPPQTSTVATVGSTTPVLSLATSKDATSPLQQGPLRTDSTSPLATISSATSSSETTTSSVSLLGQNVPVCSPISSESRLESVKKTEAPATPTFGTKSSLFGKPLFPDTSTTAFGETSVQNTGSFGKTSISDGGFGETSVPNTGSFGKTSAPSPISDGFFSQTPSFGTPTTTTVVAATTTTVAVSGLSTQASAFSFGKPAFGQTTGSFGLAKSFFGQTSNPVTQAATPLSFQSQGQNSTPVFGQGSFFSGLGGKPSEENASKNVFGFSSGVKSADSTNLFKNSTVTSLGAVNSGGTSFSSGGSFSGGGGSVSQSGFGIFQQPSTPLQPGGFGAVPSFGTPPAFGSAPAFGASPTFGSGNALSSVFGQQQQVASNFSNFANASSPTFGSLASQSPGSFGASPSIGGSGFGSPPAFGNTPSGFGSPGSPPSNSSAFTQWRN